MQEMLTDRFLNRRVESMELTVQRHQINKLQFSDTDEKGHMQTEMFPFSKNVSLNVTGDTDEKGNVWDHDTKTRFGMVIVWMLINMIPQILFAFWTLVNVVGTNSKELRSVIFKYPQFILCPAFSYFTFGAPNSGEWCYKYGFC